MVKKRIEVQPVKVEEKVVIEEAAPVIEEVTVVEEPKEFKIQVTGLVAIRDNPNGNWIYTTEKDGVYVATSEKDGFYFIGRGWVNKNFAKKI